MILRVLQPIPIISLSLALINGDERIRLTGGLDHLLDDLMKKFKGAKCNEGWHIPCNRELLKLFMTMVDGIVKPDLELLRIQLELKRMGLSIGSAIQVSEKVSSRNIDAMNRFVKTLYLKAYSESTIHHYRQEFQKLLLVLGDKDVSGLTADQIKSYMLWLITRKGYGESHANTAVNAIKFYFEKVLLAPRMVYDLPRPKKPLLLPRVMGKSSVANIITASDNVKHKTMLMMAYAAGLRVSEITALRVRDIDSDRMCINICRAKGKKDRVVTLSPILLEQLRNYYREYRPKDWLFEGRDGGRYSTRSVQQVFKDAKTKAGILQPGGIHTMRHSYATHLLESGTDIRFIKDLLGHNSLLTTLRYTHVSVRQLSQIRSPLDDLNL